MNEKYIDIEYDIIGSSLVGVYIYLMINKTIIEIYDNDECLKNIYLFVSLKPRNISECNISIENAGIVKDIICK